MGGDRSSNETKKWLREMSQLFSFPIDEEGVFQFKEVLDALGLSLVSLGRKGHRIKEAIVRWGEGKKMRRE